MREPPLMADFTVCFGTLAFYKPRQIEALLPKLWKASARGLGFITWWNLDESFVYHEHIQTLQKVIRRFIREAKPSAHFERIGDYGEPTEAAFLLVR
jgi:hypothetical protein